MAYTYSKIASTTVGSGGSASIDFIAIPQNYTDLIILYSLRSNRVATIDQVKFEFNSSTSNLSSRDLYSDGSGVASDTLSTIVRGYGNPGDNATANTFGNGQIYIPNYSGNSYKSISITGVDENNATGVNSAQAGMSAGLWSNSSPINSIKILPTNGTGFKQYSTATLYGIKAEV